jgi:hypothetical protein
MDVGTAPTFCAAHRSLLLVAPLSALLVASVGWNVWYYRLAQKRRVPAMAKERALKVAVTPGTEEVKQAKLKRQSRDAKSAGQIQQLYEEINHLTRVSEESCASGSIARSTNIATDGHAKNTIDPREIAPVNSRPRNISKCDNLFKMCTIDSDQDN